VAIFRIEFRYLDPEIPLINSPLEGQNRDLLSTSIHERYSRERDTVVGRKIQRDSPRIGHATDINREKLKRKNRETTKVKGLTSK